MQTYPPSRARAGQSLVLCQPAFRDDKRLGPTWVRGCWRETSSKSSQGKYVCLPWRQCTVAVAVALLRFTSRTINKTMACCFLLRQIIFQHNPCKRSSQGDDSPAQEPYAHPMQRGGTRNMLRYHRDHKSFRRRQERYYLTSSVSINSSVPKPWEVVSLLKQVLTYTPRDLQCYKLARHPS